MALSRFLIVCALLFGLVNCRKKSEAVGNEVREAGYAMTPEGWFGAVGDNDVAVMRKMAEGGFDLKTKDSGGDSALHIAAAAGAKEAAEFLLNKGFPIDGKGAKGRTPLMAAVTADQPEMVQWLLRQGADPKLKDEDGFMALMLAVTGGGEKAVKEIAPYHREDLDSALLLASLVGEAEVIDTLTNYGASVYARMEDGRTPLMLAAQNGHKEAAAMLIDIGASRFATTESGETAQSMAVSAGHTELAEMIEKGFSGDTLALESDEEVAEAMNDYLDESQMEPEESSGGGNALASKESDDGGNAPWNAPVPGQGGGSFGSLPDKPDSDGGDPKPIRSLEGARVSNPVSAEDFEISDGIRLLAARSGEDTKVVSKKLSDAVRRSAEKNGVELVESPKVLPLVMRQYRQKELPVEVKRVSAGVASLHIAGEEPREVKVKAGETIPGSSLVIVRVFNRTEHGKLNGGESIEVGIVEVEDNLSGQKAEWIAGRPASGHDPVALVEDAATGRRYLAKPGQKFQSEDGREFIVNDVRPSQVVIEDVASGEVRTLRLRGPRG